MRKILLTAIALTTASFVSNIASARDSSNGCGLGWEVTSRTSFSATSTRSTTNVFVPPTFGMTSGTLGCAKHDLVQKRDEAAAVYAVENYDSLRQEMAEGKGENLRAFADLMGCNAGAYDGFAKMVRSRFQSIVGNSDAQLDLVVNVRSQIDQDAALSFGCNAS